MALQLGSLREALMHPGDEAKANKAAEEVGGYDRDLTRLNTMVQAILALLLILIGSQAFIWTRVGELGGQLTSQGAQLTSQGAQLASISAQLGSISAKIH